MFKCCDCENCFDEPNVVWEYMGEFWGAPAHQRYEVCPCCGSASFEEIDEEDEETEEQSDWNGTVDIQTIVKPYAEKLVSQLDQHLSWTDYRDQDIIHFHRYEEAAVTLLCCTYLKKPFSTAKSITWGSDYDFGKIEFTDRSEYQFFFRGAFGEGIKIEVNEQLSEPLRFPDNFDQKYFQSEDQYYASLGVFNEN